MSDKKKHALYWGDRDQVARNNFDEIARFTGPVPRKGEVVTFIGEDGRSQGGHVLSVGWHLFEGELVASVFIERE